MTRNYEKTDVRKQQIINAARKIIVQDGGEQVTVKKIAREVGISETAIYRHFSSKKEILGLLVEHIEEILVGDLTAVTAAGNETAMERLEATLKRHISAIEKRRGISFQVMAEIISFGDRDLKAKVLRAIEKYTASIKDLLMAGVKSGEVRSDIDADAVATVLFGTISSLVNIWALRGYDVNPKRKYLAIWGFLRSAIASQ